MGYSLWKTALIYLLVQTSIQRIRFVDGNANSSSHIFTSSISLISSNTLPSNISQPSSSSAPTPTPKPTKTTNNTSSTNLQISVTSVTHANVTSQTGKSNVASSLINKTTSYSIMPTKSFTFTNTVASIRPTGVVSSVTTSISTTIKPTHGDDDEPKLSLYIWEIVACASGISICLLFIIIGILCFQNKSLRKKVRSLQSYSIPIKENGLWIDNQDIPLWQKRASTLNVTENARSQESEAT